MSNRTAKVKTETIASCMTCPLCNKFFRDATTIIECLHTFCRKCIYKKLDDEELECCPICDIDLGCVPLEKLRPDHSLQDVRANIFPFKRRKVKAPEVIHSVSLPAKRKERSLSSLVVSTPRVSSSSQSPLTGKRSKAVGRKASSSRATGFTPEKDVKKEEDSTDGNEESSSSLEIRRVGKEREDGSESKEGKDLWKPLNCLVEAANRSKSTKYISQGSTDNNNNNNSDGQAWKYKGKASVSNNIDPIASELVQPKKLRKTRLKKAPASSSGERFISPQDVLDATSARAERRTGPVWFSLVPAELQEGIAPLAQIPASFLRIRDGSMPVSFIQKYLVTKLNLTNEDEVEIKCMGERVIPTLQLNHLVDLWLQSTSTPSQRVSALIGSSAKEFVMVLTYSRKVPHP